MLPISSVDSDPPVLGDLTVGFPKLPPELKVMIFRYLYHAKDCQSVVLVSRDWRDHIAPLMWWKLVISVPRLETRPLAALLHPENGILPYVRALVIGGENSTIPWEEKYERTLGLVVCALPKEQLRTFYSGRPASLTFLLLLLQNQQKLRKLVILLAPLKLDEKHVPSLPGIRSLVDVPWIGQYLTDIESLHAQVPASGIDDGMRLWENFRCLVANSPKLKHLAIGHVSLGCKVSTIPKLLFGCTGTDVAPKPLPLRGLDLFAIDFEGMQSTLHRHIDFSTLTRLHLRDCEYQGVFLGSLAARYSRGPCALKALRVSFGPTLRVDTTNPLQALEKLLSSFSGLEVCIIYTAQYGLVNPASIIAHGESLVSLGVDSLGQYYPVPLLRSILEACPRLKQLAVALSRVYLGRISRLAMSLNLDAFLKPGPVQECEAMLEVIGSHPKLHTLRVLSLPLVDYEIPGHLLGQPPPASYLHFLYVILGNFSTQVIRNFAARGSKIVVFALAPLNPHLLGPRNRHPPNAMWLRHWWPTYEYKRGRLITAAGREEIVAVPVVGALRTEIKDSDILEGFGGYEPWLV